MGALNVTAVILGSRDGSQHDAMNVGISVSDAKGMPLSDLMETDVQIRIVDRDNAISPSVLFSAQQQATDENGDPVFDENGEPVMVNVPGPARSMGLSGFYRMILIPPPTGWVTSPFMLTIEITKNGDSGQAFGSFADETQLLRFRVASELESMLQQLTALLGAYSRTTPLR